MINIKWNNGPNNRIIIIKKKNQIICSKDFKGGTRRDPFGIVIKPGLILTKPRQQYTIVTIRCHHQSMFVWVLKAKVLKKVHLIFKLSSLLFYLSFKMRRRLNFFFRNSFHIAGPLEIEIRNLHLHNLICGFL